MLDVSRTDIISSELMEFTPSDRFIKLPISEYMNLLGIEPNSSQTALINAVNNPKYRFVCAAISRRCLLYTSPSPRDGLLSRMPSSA